MNWRCDALVRSTSNPGNSMNNNNGSRNTMNRIHSWVYLFYYWYKVFYHLVAFFPIYLFIVTLWLWSNEQTTNKLVHISQKEHGKQNGIHNTSAQASAASVLCHVYACAKYSIAWNRKCTITWNQFTTPDKC